MYVWLLIPVFTFCIVTGAGVDYFGSLMSLTLSDLIRSGSITFTIVDDDLREGEESFTVVISSVLPLGVAETPAQYASTTVRITDDDRKR